MVDSFPAATREYLTNTMQLVHDDIVVGLLLDLHTHPAVIAPLAAL